MMSNPTVEGRALRLLRTDRRVSRARLAERCSVSASTLGAYENGTIPIPEATLARLLDALELPETAWFATVELVRTLDWISEPATVPGGAGPVDLAAARERIPEMASRAGRDREREIYQILELLLAALHPREDPEKG